MFRFTITAAVLGFLGASFAPSMRADERDKLTRITIDQPLQVQDVLLAPGQYVFKLLTPDSSRRVISIYSADGRQPQGIVLGLPAYRLDPTDHSLFTVSQPEVDQPAALTSWFYPGDNSGVEFQVTKPAHEARRETKSKGTVQASD